MEEEVEEEECREGRKGREGRERRSRRMERMESTLPMSRLSRSQSIDRCGTLLGNCTTWLNVSHFL